MRKTLGLVFVLVVGITMGAVGNQALNAQQPSAKVTVLLKHDLRGFQNKEVMLLELVGSPGWQSPWHHHPGQEFVYVAEGSVGWETKGQPPKTLPSGSAFHNDLEAVHNIKNAGTTPLRLIGCLVAEKGMPQSIPDDPPSK